MKGIQRMFLLLNFFASNRIFKFLSVTDILNGNKLIADNAPFTIIMGNGDKITADMMEVTDAPAIKILDSDPKASVYSKRINGKEIVVNLEHKSSGLSVFWHGILRDGSNYIRQQIVMKSNMKQLKVDSVILVELPLTGARVEGSVQGSPVVTDHMFFSFEHPLSDNNIKNGDLRCSYFRNGKLNPGTKWVFSSSVQHLFWI